MDCLSNAGCKWAVQRGSDLSFEHVHTLASELFAGIQNPQTATTVVRYASIIHLPIDGSNRTAHTMCCHHALCGTQVQVLRNWMPTREKDRLPIDICMLIMRHVIQCDAIDMLLAPLLSVFTPPPGSSSTVYSFMQDAVRFSTICDNARAGGVSRDNWRRQLGQLEEASQVHLNSLCDANAQAGGCGSPVWVAQSWTDQVENLPFDQSAQPGEAGAMGERDAQEKRNSWVQQSDLVENQHDGQWSCANCTFFNDVTANSCAICSAPNISNLRGGCNPNHPVAAAPFSSAPAAYSSTPAGTTL